jgi:hypothetical protein
MVTLDQAGFARPVTRLIQPPPVLEETVEQLFVIDHGAVCMRLLAVFLHEQFHWWVISDGRHVGKNLAVAEFEKLFPEVPAREEGGANNRQSTYLHLVVCDLEFQAMTQLIGEEAARRLMARASPYEWIYDELLTDPRVREVNTRNGLLVPES